jgi:hypothetical protein
LKNRKKEGHGKQLLTYGVPAIYTSIEIFKVVARRAASREMA